MAEKGLEHPSCGEERGGGSEPLTVQSELSPPICVGRGSPDTYDLGGGFPPERNDM